jgi:hypothetical protein
VSVPVHIYYLAAVPASAPYYAPALTPITASFRCLSQSLCLRLCVPCTLSLSSFPVSNPAPAHIPPVART